MNNKQNIFMSYVSYILFMIGVISSSALLIILSTKTSIKIQLGDFTYYISIIGVLYIVYFLFRTINSYIYHKRFSNLEKLNELIENNYNENDIVGVSVPFYNDSVDDIQASIRSLLDQTHKNLKIYLVNDGSTSNGDYEDMINNYKEKYPGRIVYISYEKNKGKRHAMYESFNAMLNDKVGYILTIDGDTVIDKNAVKNLLATVKSDKKFGSTTGQVLSNNMINGNLLQKMIGIRYVMAFNWERASQANYGGINCNSGPLTIYKAEVIAKIKDDFVSQTFLGKEATYGDDRHLTNKTLESGYKTVYQPFAYAFTDTPETLNKYLNQQVRWSKSYIRELLWQLRVLPKFGLPMVFDFLMHIWLPIFLVFSYGFLLFKIISIVFLSNILGLSIAGLAMQSFMFFTLVIVTAVARSIYVSLYIKKKVLTGIRGYEHINRYSILYSLLFVFLLIFIKPWAMITIFNTKWGTR